MLNKLDTLGFIIKIMFQKMAVGIIGASRGIGRLLFESLKETYIEVTVV